MKTLENPYDWSGSKGEKWLAHMPRMERMLSVVDGPLVEALELQQPCRIADVGCGGGATSRSIVWAAKPGSVVHGYDVSGALVDAARAVSSRSSVAAHSELDFFVSDMGRATPPDLAYDRLCSRFGVMFFEHPQTAFSNLLKWLRPGGSLAFAVWGDPKQNGWLGVVREEVAKAIEVPASLPDAPGPFRYADGQAFARLLTDSGFVAVEVKVWRSELPLLGTASEAAKFALTSFSSFAELLSQASQSDRDRVEQALTQRLAPHYREGSVFLPCAVNIVTARR